MFFFFVVVVGPKLHCELKYLLTGIWQITTYTLLYTFCRGIIFLFFSFRIDLIFNDSFFNYSKKLLWSVRIFYAIGFASFTVAISLTNKSKPDSHNDSCITHFEPQYVLIIAVLFDVLMNIVLIFLLARKIYLVCQIKSSTTKKRLVPFLTHCFFVFSLVFVQIFHFSFLILFLLFTLFPHQFCTCFFFSL